MFYILSSYIKNSTSYSSDLLKCIRLIKKSTNILLSKKEKGKRIKKKVWYLNRLGDKMSKRGGKINIKN